MANRRGGFTLVEMLVVISIIALLMTMLFPAIGMVREAAKRAQCVNNLHNYGEAMIMYEGQKGYLPGYRANMPIFNTSGVATGSNLVVGWQVTLLPNLQKNDVYKQWTDYCSGLTANLPVPTAWELSVCPSSAKLDKTQPNTTYVANCGHYDATTAPYAGIDTRDTAVFHDMTWAPSVYVKQTLDFVARSDGCSNTIMITENVDATTWSPTNPNPVAGYTTTPGSVDELLLGVVYDPLLYTGSTVAATANTPYKVNYNRGVAHPTTTVAGALPYSRPSSGHPGGVVAAFCDASARFVKEDLGSSVVATANPGYSPAGPWDPRLMLGYLMTPNGRRGRNISGSPINEPIIPSGTF